MKNILRMIGVIALVAIIGFAFVACGEDRGNNNNTACTICGETPCVCPPPPPVNFNQEGILYRLLNETGYEVLGFSYTKRADVIIPETINDLPVTSIKQRAFYGCNAIKNITIPASVIEIGDEAFWVTSLETITFAEGSKLESIGDEAFGCSKITEITIPANVIEIGRAAFFDCKDLETVTFTEGSKLESIGDGAFLYSKITEITIPASVIEIGNRAFGQTSYYSSYDSSLETVTFAEGSKLESIGDEAFGCTKITEITIPASVIEIGNLAFYGTSLETIIFAEGSKLESIGDEAFNYTEITEITIPASVIEIGNLAFASCQNLQVITFAGNSQLQTIGNWAFSFASIITITIPISVTSIGEGAFALWQESQTIYIPSHTDEVSADLAWGVMWRKESDAVIIYGQSGN